VQQTWLRQGQSYAPVLKTFIIDFQGKTDLIACIFRFAMTLRYSLIRATKPRESKTPSKMC